jgi:hypothetical protein
MKKLSLVFALAALIASCKKTTSTISGNPVICGTTQDVSKSYFPLTPGDIWHSTVQNFNGDVGYVDQQILSSTVMYNGKTFYTKEYGFVMNGIRSVEDSEYYRVEDSDIIMYDPFDRSAQTLLKPNAVALETWSDTVVRRTNFDSILVRVERKIAEKDINYIASGRAYQQVLHVRETEFQDFDSNGSYETQIAYYDIYYAKGVGVIEKSMDGGSAYPEFNIDCFGIQ